MPSTKELVVQGYVTERETGLWCDACFLPSAIRVVVVCVIARTLSVIGRVELHQCVECGKETS